MRRGPGMYILLFLKRLEEDTPALDFGRSPQVGDLAVDGCSMAVIAL